MISIFGPRSGFVSELMIHVWDTFRFYFSAGWPAKQVLMIFDVQMFRDKLAKELFLDIISAVSLSVKECKGLPRTLQDYTVWLCS